MTDVAVAYTLTTGGGTINFNGGALNDGSDMYYLTNIQGLGQPPIRAPLDNKPQDHGGLIHNFWKGPRHIAFEGAFLIQSTRIQTTIETARNSMFEALEAALDSILQAAGTLAWTPLGSTARTLAVYSEIPLQDDGVELRTFTFGLVAPDPDPVLST